MSRPGRKRDDGRLYFCCVILIIEFAMCACVRVYVYIRVRVYMCVCGCLCMFVCMYTYVRSYGSYFDHVINVDYTSKLVKVFSHIYLIPSHT